MEASRNDLVRGSSHRFSSVYSDDTARDSPRDADAECNPLRQYRRLERRITKARLGAG